jgi:predicted nucleotidyltransferase
MDQIRLLRTIKPVFLKEGFVIDGVVGSVARGQKGRDLDLLYHLEEPFFTRHPGFKAFARLEEIKALLSHRLGVPVDLVAASSLSKTAKAHMMKDLLDV